jgi:hypothetical protein
MTKEKLIKLIEDAIQSSIERMAKSLIQEKYRDYDVAEGYKQALIWALERIKELNGIS